MPAPRTDKSTIPDNKNPIATVHYSQPQPKPPIEALISDTTKEAKKEPTQEHRKKPDPQPDQKVPKGKVTVLVENDLLDRLRNAAYWQRKTLATIAEEGLRLVVERLEKQHGGRFEPREEDLKTGRPQGSRNGTSKAR